MNFMMETLFCLLILISSPDIARSTGSPGCMWSTDCETNGCESGSYCKVMVSYPATGGLSQCVENLVNVNAKCYPTSNGNYYSHTRRGCTNDEQCCNEFASCGADRLCHLSCTMKSDPSYPPTALPQVEVSLEISILFANSTVPFLDRSHSLALSAGIANTLDLRTSSVEVIDSAPKRRRLKELYVLSARAQISPTDDEVPTPYRNDRPGLYTYYSSLLSSLTIRNILLDEYQKELYAAGIEGEPDLKILAIGTPSVPINLHNDQETTAQSSVLGMDVSSFSVLISLLGVLLLVVIIFTLYYVNRHKRMVNRTRQGNSLSGMSMINGQMKSSVDNVDLVIDSYSWRVPSLTTASQDPLSQEGISLNPSHVNTLNRQRSRSRDGNNMQDSAAIGNSVYNTGNQSGSSSSSCSWRLPSPRGQSAENDVDSITDVRIPELSLARSKSSFSVEGQNFSLPTRDTEKDKAVYFSKETFPQAKTAFNSSIMKITSSSSSSHITHDCPPKIFETINNLSSQDSSSTDSRDDEDSSRSNSPQGSGASYCFNLPIDQTNAHIHTGVSLDSDDGESIVIGIEGTSVRSASVRSSTGMSVAGSSITASTMCSM